METGEVIHKGFETMSKNRDEKSNAKQKAKLAQTVQQEQARTICLRESLEPRRNVEP